MNDLFEREQTILDNALSNMEEAQRSGTCSAEVYASLVNEYSRLLRQLRRVTRISDKTTENLNISKQVLQNKAHYDELTGIYNRRFLDETLRETVKILEQEDGILTVMMVDVDFFKRYNDTYGHSAGDHCLRTIAQCLKESLPCQGEFVARYGGEEFVAVLPGVNDTGAHKAAVRLLEYVRKRRIPHKASEVAPYITVSVGVATSPVTAGSTPEAYLEAADQALYCSKRNGRDQYTYGKVRFEEVI